MSDGTPRLPLPPSRWFLLLPLLAIAIWWPIEPYWASDDYFALHYASDLGRALHDFVGPQYGATDIWFFYRPLITLSFWLDQQIGGGAPFVSHLSNGLAHGLSTLFVGLLWRRFLDDGAAFLAGLLWAAMPSHLASVAWAVGRVDSHTAVWCLACLWAFARHCERARAGERAPRWPSLGLLAGALASKELAWVVPPLASCLAVLLAPVGGRARLAFAARRSAPLWVLFAVYFALRFAVLGRIGGYEATQFAPWPMVRGLGAITADLLVPLRWVGTAGTMWTWLAAAPIALATLLALRRPRAVAVAAALFLLAAAPMAGFFAAADNHHNLRYFYLPSVALVGLFALPGRPFALLVLAAWSWPLYSARVEQLAADRTSATMHRALLAQLAERTPPLAFVAGLPRANASGLCLQFHFGVDRLARAPFADVPTHLYALRPIDDAPAMLRLDEPGQPPTALPEGDTLWFADRSALGLVDAAPTLPDLPITGDLDGVVDLSSDRLRELAVRARDQRHGEAHLVTHAGKPAWFRVTIFTATGYFACLCQDHGAVVPGSDPGTGVLDLVVFLAGDSAFGVPVEQCHIHPAQYGPEAYVMLGLEVPTTIDLLPELPVLLEAGEWRNGAFAPTHRARRLLRWRFDRGYPAWVRRPHGV